MLENVRDALGQVALAARVEELQVELGEANDEKVDLEEELDRLEPERDAYHMMVEQLIDALWDEADASFRCMRARQVVKEAVEKYPRRFRVKQRAKVLR